MPIIMIDLLDTKITRNDISFQLPLSWESNHSFLWVWYVHSISFEMNKSKVKNWKQNGRLSELHTNIKQPTSLTHISPCLSVNHSIIFAVVSPLLPPLKLTSSYNFIWVHSPYLHPIFRANRELILNPNTRLRLSQSLLDVLIKTQKSKFAGCS